MFLRNVGKHSPNFTASHPRRHSCYNVRPLWTRSPDQAVVVPPSSSVCIAVNRDVTSAVVAVCHVINLALRHDRRCNILAMQHTLLQTPSGSIDSTTWAEKGHWQFRTQHTIPKCMYLPDCTASRPQDGASIYPDAQRSAHLCLQFAIFVDR
jgi:hypothetical protein